VEVVQGKHQRSVGRNYRLVTPEEIIGKCHIFIYSPEGNEWYLCKICEQGKEHKLKSYIRMDEQGMGKKDWQNKEAREFYTRTVNTLLMKFDKLPNEEELNEVMNIAIKVTKRNLSEFS